MFLPENPPHIIQYKRARPEYQALTPLQSMSVAATTFSSSSLQRYHCDRYVFRGIKRGQLKSSTKSTKVVSSLQEGDKTIVIIGGTGRVGSVSANAIQKAYLNRLQR